MSKCFFILLIDCLFRPKEKGHSNYQESNFVSGSSTYQPVTTQEKYPPSYINSDKNLQREAKERKLSNEENDKLKREELLRIYDLYKRHSLKESLDSIRQKVDGLLESRYTRSDLREDESSQNSNSDVGVLALRRAIKLLKNSIKEHLDSDKKSVDIKTGGDLEETKNYQKKKGTEISKQEEHHPIVGREEIAIPIYSSSEEEHKEAKKGNHVKKIFLLFFTS